MFRIAIVEDEDACARLLEDYIRRYGETAGDAFRTDRFPNGLEFIENYRPVYDVILMDIRMPLVDGMETARRLRAQDEETALIFVTNMAQYAIKGYEVQALDFMLKPVQYYDFEMKFSKAIRYCRKRSAAALSFEAGGTVHRVPARDVSCVEVMNHSLLYHVGDAVYEVYGQLKAVEEQLAGGDFVRCSQSHLVNLRHVTEVRAASVFVVYFFSLWARLREPVTVSSSFFESLCCVLLLFLQFGLFERSKLQQQNAILQQILHLEQEQHRTSTENIELINRKCHDLKHQISALRYIDSRKEQEESIRQIELAVMIYDLSVKTGNDALDIVLAEKSLYCGEYNIRLSCIADGSRLNFMEDADVYALFGNAFDNAVESVCQLKDPEKRVISLHIYCRGSCLAIHMENYCDHPVAFEDDLPVTTKGDKDYHGYGTRSMRCLTEKYGGTMTLRTEGELFVLNILFPLNRS